MTLPTIKRRKANAPAYPYDHRVQPKAVKHVQAMIAQMGRISHADLQRAIRLTKKQYGKTLRDLARISIPAPKGKK